MNSKYSVVHNGPIKYTKELWRALTYARTCAKRKGFMLDGVWHKLAKGEKLTVYRLQPKEGQNDVVQQFEVE